MDIFSTHKNRPLVFPRYNFEVVEILADEMTGDGQAAAGYRQGL